MLTQKFVIGRRYLAAAVCALTMLMAGTAAAEGSLEDRLFEELLTADAESTKRIEKNILVLWSDSGSRSFNFLLERGRRAIAAGNYDAAIDHLTALVDHAPDFAEGWNARATAWYLMGEYELSVADIAQTLVRNERHFGALSGLAMIYELQGREREAIAVYQEVQKLHPQRPGLSKSIQRLQEKLFEQSI